MPPKLRHACERCGLEAVYERASRFRDEDHHELLHEYLELEQSLRQAQALRHYAETRLERARERIGQLQALVNAAPDPEPEIEAAEELPF